MQAKIGCGRQQMLQGSQRSFIASQCTDIQLVSPKNHHVNAAEKAIATLKEYFIAALPIFDSNCPLQLWHEFLEKFQEEDDMVAIFWAIFVTLHECCSVNASSKFMLPIIDS